MTTFLMICIFLFQGAFSVPTQKREDSKCSDGWYVTGTGKVAEEETFRITSNNNRVCFVATKNF